MKTRSFSPLLSETRLPSLPMTVNSSVFSVAAARSATRLGARRAAGGAQAATRSKAAANTTSPDVMLSAARPCDGHTWKRYESPASARLLALHKAL